MSIFVFIFARPPPGLYLWTPCGLPSPDLLFVSPLGNSGYAPASCVHHCSGKARPCSWLAKCLIFDYHRSSPFKGPMLKIELYFRFRNIQRITTSYNHITTNRLPQDALHGYQAHSLVVSVFLLTFFYFLISFVIFYIFRCSLGFSPLYSHFSDLVCFLVYVLRQSLFLVISINI